MTQRCAQRGLERQRAANRGTEKHAALSGHFNRLLLPPLGALLRYLLSNRRSPSLPDATMDDASCVFPAPDRPERILKCSQTQMAQPERYVSQCPHASLHLPSSFVHLTRLHETKACPESGKQASPYSLLRTAITLLRIERCPSGCRPDSASRLTNEEIDASSYQNAFEILVHGNIPCK